MGIFRKTARLTLVAAIGLLAFYACSSSITEPVADNSVATAWESQSFQNEIPAILEQHGDIYAEVAARPVNGRLFAWNTIDMQFVRGSWLVKLQTVPVDEETTVSFGTDEAGYSEITFPAGAFDDDVIVTIVMKLDGAREFYFYPEGNFNEPVGAVLSYAGTNVKDSDEESLRLFVYDVVKEVLPQAVKSPNPKMRVVEENGWILVNGSWVNPDSDRVYAELEHFSRYAIGSDTE